MPLTLAGAEMWLGLKFVSDLHEQHVGDVNCRRCRSGHWPSGGLMCPVGSLHYTAGLLRAGGRIGMQSHVGPGLD